MVAGVTRALLDLGANLEDASMTRLGGEFSMMLVVSLPKISDAHFKKALAPLRRLGLEVSAKAIPSKLALVKKQEAPDALISVYGTDRPGIVYEVTKCLAKRKANITDLNTKVVQGDAAGNMYIMLLEIQLPDGQSMEALGQDLEALKKTLGVEITLQGLDPVEL